jgi:exodeoxyribonuclease VII large subunit
MPVQTVTQLTRAIREVLEETIGEVWVEGEVSNYRKHASGHQYFTLKDAKAQLSCVFFRGRAWNSRTRIQDGVKLQLFGDLSLYEARGQYQLVVREARALGAGDLHEQFEALKLKLREEGLFNEDRKQAIPRFPQRLGIITSPTGAVIRDLLSVLKRRAPWVEVQLFPAAVQGQGAYRQLIEGLETLTERREVDAIILARGGGSLEDLWNFNEEALARAIAACPLPVISAVGHETDFSIADFVADLRAPTPSAAAELTVPDQRELRAFLGERRRQLSSRVQRRLSYLSERLEWMRREGAFQRPHRILQEYSQRLDELAEDLHSAVQLGLRDRRQRCEGLQQALRVLSPEKQFLRLQERLQGRREQLERAVRRQVEKKEARVEALTRHLQALGPSQTLARGYSILLDEKHRPLTTVKQMKEGEKVKARLQDGEVPLRVEKRPKK